MVDDQSQGTGDTGPDTTADAPRPRRRRAASRPAGPPAAPPAEGAQPGDETPPGAVADREVSAVSPPSPAKGTRSRSRRTAKSAPAAEPAPTPEVPAGEAEAAPVPAAEEVAAAEPAAPARPATRRRRATKAAAAPSAEAPPAEPATEPLSAEPATEPPPAEPAATEPPAPRKRSRRATKAAAPAPTAAESATPAPAVEPAGPETGAPEATEASTASGPVFRPPVFQAPDFTVPERVTAALVGGDEIEPDVEPESAGEDADEDREDGGTRRRRRRRGGRGRRKEAGEDTEVGDAADGAGEETASPAGRESAGLISEEAEPDTEAAGDEEAEAGGTRRRRRRRRRRGEGDDEVVEEPNTVVKVREPRSRAEVADEVTGLKGSTRLEAKKQRRREGREAGRRRPPIVSEAEFLARRESVDRVMVVRQAGGRTQIAVLEDGVLVEHYVSREQQQSMIGNVYLGRVQNVLPAMEAAFVDVGRGRNAVLYAGEVDWAGLGLSGGPKRIEEALKSGQSVLVQVTKDPVGHKGARLTSQISLPGRYLVYVPGGAMSGISRKLPDTERNRLKRVLKQVVPEDAGVIVRTAAEGASEDELTRDVARLTAQWEDIRTKASSGSAPQLLYGEPDLTVKVVRDLFNEDFAKLVVSGDEAWETVEPYVSFVAPSLADRLERWVGTEDVFTRYRVDEQIAKALDRKVWLPSGGSLVIDRTEAMTVVDVNTGKFTGSGGNLEQTVTKNNLEAAEEVVRQLRLRDIGGIIVIDFIDMVLESNRDLVLRRLVECLGRDRTKHQVAEVTSLGLVQMTRKKIGTGLVEAFSETCEHCKGRGVIVRLDQAGSASSGDPDQRPSGGRAARGGGRDAGGAAAASSDGAAAQPTADAASGDGDRPARRRRGSRSARSAGGPPPAAPEPVPTAG